MDGWMDETTTMGVRPSMCMCHVLVAIVCDVNLVVFRAADAGTLVVFLSV
jgi:hypothetical protein